MLQLISLLLTFGGALAADAGTPEVAFTTTWRVSDPKSSPYAAAFAVMCLETHMDLPLYLYYSAVMSAMSIPLRAYPEFAHNTTCTKLGYKEDYLTLCKKENFTASSFCETAEKVWAEHDFHLWLIPQSKADHAQSVEALMSATAWIDMTAAEDSPNSEALSLTADARTPEVAFTTTWRVSDPKSSPYAAAFAVMCLETHIDLPLFAYYSVVMSAMSIPLRAYPGVAHNTTCTKLGYKEDYLTLCKKEHKENETASSSCETAEKVWAERDFHLWLVPEQNTIPVQNVDLVARTLELMNQMTKEAHPSADSMSEGQGWHVNLV